MLKLKTHSGFHDYFLIEIYSYLNHVIIIKTKDLFPSGIGDISQFWLSCLDSLGFAPQDFERTLKYKVYVYSAQNLRKGWVDLAFILSLHTLYILIHCTNIVCVFIGIRDNN